MINSYLNRKFFELMNHLREYIKVLLIGFCHLQKAGFIPKWQPIIKMVSVPNVRVTVYDEGKSILYKKVRCTDGIR